MPPLRVNVVNFKEWLVLAEKRRHVKSASVRLYNRSCSIERRRLALTTAKQPPPEVAVGVTPRLQKEVAQSPMVSTRFGAQIGAGYPDTWAPRMACEELMGTLPSRPLFGWSIQARHMTLFSLGWPS